MKKLITIAALSMALFSTSSMARPYGGVVIYTTPGYHYHYVPGYYNPYYGYRYAPKPHYYAPGYYYAPRHYYHRYYRYYR